MNSAFFTEEGDMVKNRNKILAMYINRKLFKDLVSSVPVDYALLAINSSQTLRSYIRLLRLFKFYRVKQLLILLRKFAQMKFNLFNLVTYFVMFIFLNHFVACLFFYIGRLQL